MKPSGRPAELPTKELIDPVTADTPVFVSRYDGHMGLANSVGLASWPASRRRLPTRPAASSFATRKEIRPAL